MPVSTIRKNVTVNDNVLTTFLKHKQHLRSIIPPHTHFSFFLITFIFSLYSNRCSDEWMDVHRALILILLVSWIWFYLSQTEFGCCSTLAAVTHVAGHTKSHFVTIMDCWMGDQLIPIQQKSWGIFILLGKCPSCWPQCLLQGWSALMCFGELVASFFVKHWWLFLQQKGCFWHLLRARELGCGHFVSSWISHDNF